MDDADLIGRVAAVLRDAAETHHAVYRSVDGADDDWATWYSDWLVNLSPLGGLLGATPVRSALTVVLVQAAAEADADPGGEPWDHRYARMIVDRLRA